jgi:hypothetical protein
LLEFAAQQLKLMVCECFCGKFKKSMLFFAGFGKTNLVSEAQPTLNAYAEKGAAGVYSS